MTNSTRWPRPKLVGGCPYGYNHRDIIDTKHLDRHGRQIVLDTVREKHPEQAWVVHQIFTWFAEGRSTREIATELNTTGVPSPGSTWERTNTGPNAKRCAGWVGSAVYAMLQNEMYHGLYIWNRFKWKKSQPGSSKRTPVERPGRNGSSRPGRSWLSLMSACGRRPKPALAAARTTIQSSAAVANLVIYCRAFSSAVYAAPTMCWTTIPTTAAPARTQLSVTTKCALPGIWPKN